MEFYSKIPLALVKERATSGSRFAALYLARRYNNPSVYPHPEIGEKDEAEAERWHRQHQRLLELAAEGGDEYAVKQLSTASKFHKLRDLARGGFPYARKQLSELELFRDPADAQRWGPGYLKLVELAARRGDRIAMLALAELLLKRDPVEAEKWEREYQRLVEPAAKRGDRGAMYELAESYRRFDMQEDAIHWMLRAANAGHIEACRSMGDENRDSNPVEALRWYANVALEDPAVLDKEIPGILDVIRRIAEKRNPRLRAEAGDPEAQFEMGHYYYPDHGTIPDLDEAYRWWFKAADQGHEGAIEWVKEAADQGREDAIEMLKKLDE